MVRFVQIILGIILCLLIYGTTKKIMDNTSAIIALIIAILYVPFIYFETQLLNSILVITVLTAGFYVFLDHDTDKELNLIKLFASGFIVGLA